MSWNHNSSNVLIYRFFPYILVLSCVFLLITFSIYIRFASKLLNHYTTLMLHLCITLFVAFFILSINQFYHFAKDYIVLCQIFGRLYIIICMLTFFTYYKEFTLLYSESMYNTFLFFLGFILQYSFLCSFTFMTVMGLESWIQIKQSTW